MAVKSGSPYPYSITSAFPLGPDAAAVRRLRDMAATARRDPETIAISFKGPLRFQDGAGRDRTPLTGSAAQIAQDLSAYVAAGGGTSCSTSRSARCPRCSSCWNA